MQKLLCIVIFTMTLFFCESAKILAIFPTPCISHQLVFRSLVNGLHEKGHEIVVIATDSYYPNGQTPPNFTEIISPNHHIWHDYMQVIKGNSAYNHIRSFINIMGLATKLIDAQLKLPDVKKLLSNVDEKFDLIFTEQWIRGTLAFSYRFKAPVISVSTLGGVYGVFEVMGAEAHPLLYPMAISETSVNLSMWEKVYEYYKSFTMDRAMLDIENEDNKMLQRHFGPNIPSVYELEKNIHMLFLTFHSIWDGNRPVPANVVYLGALHQEPEKELPTELKTFLDSSKNGVIYVSFGTSARPSLLYPEKVKLLMKVLSELPYDVLWKLDIDEIPTQYKNIKFSKWFPQADILRHPKIKLFITQAGLQSTDEAVMAGVPLIAFPVYGDQFCNSEKYKRHRIGLKLSLATITEDEFRNSVETVINDKSYKENIIKLRSYMYDSPQTPMEKAIWWTEYVLRHKGAEQLQAAGFHMSRIEYYEIKLVLTVLVVLTLILIVIFKIVQYLLRYVLPKVKDD